MMDVVVTKIGEMCAYRGYGNMGWLSFGGFVTWLMHHLFGFSWIMDSVSFDHQRFCEDLIKIFRKSNQTNLVQFLNLHFRFVIFKNDATRKCGRVDHAFFFSFFIFIIF